MKFKTKRFEAGERNCNEKFQFARGTINQAGHTRGTAATANI
jgi:hypothetical protein